MKALLAPFRWLYCMFLRWCIWEAENHLFECAKDGLSDSLSMREFRGQISAMRVRLALLQVPACAKGAQQPAVNSTGPAAASGGSASSNGALHEHS